MINPNLLTWTYASLRKYFEINKGTNNVHFEGDKVRTDTLAEYTEIRIIGPDFDEQANNDIELALTVNFKITVDAGIKQVYRTHQIAGYWLNYLNNIPVKRYGVAPDEEDDSTIYCLQRQNRVRFIFEGLVAPDVAKKTAMLIATFKQSITNV